MTAGTDPRAAEAKLMMRLARYTRMMPIPTRA